MAPDSLDIKRYVPGQCFLCRKPTEDKEAYIHYECAISYSEDKQKRIKEAWADKNGYSN